MARSSASACSNRATSGDPAQGLQFFGPVRRQASAVVGHHRSHRLTDVASLGFESSAQTQLLLIAIQGADRLHRDQSERHQSEQIDCQSSQQGLLDRDIEPHELPLLLRQLLSKRSTRSVHSADQDLPTGLV